eukprot:TRINITY_DN15384_c0_g1_i5.p1 TRINITY_DN15384_c0_g1~~TRINITY_DN15384_c0_g1_i5.p1  ORF type:complete len:405 (+),score=26.89 TRINITY_DN15384_c0_g1_i5:232-1446(+)
MKQTYMMNKSTIIMPCNITGFTDPQSTRGWGIVDFDWWNARGAGTADGWAKHKPMDDEEMLYQQVRLTTNATPGTTVWVYRNSVYAYPWFTDVRRILEDPAYQDWFIRFKPEGPWYSPKCDDHYDPPLCSDLYHSQTVQDYGTCSEPACDCGKVPCGYYVFNHSSTTVVNNQSFQQWFIYSYVLNRIGTSPLVSGFFWDDVWNDQCIIHDQVPQTCEDMGLVVGGTTLAQLTRDYRANMEALRRATLAAGRFAWQMLWTGGDETEIGSTCPEPLVKKRSCATDLRSLCSARSPAQTRAMMYAFSPGGCGADPSIFTSFDQDLANFLLVRGKYAWLGHGWKGASRQYPFPERLNADYGEPLELCHETSLSSNVFVRRWTRASIRMDCNSWKANIDFQTQDSKVFV